MRQILLIGVVIALLVAGAVFTSQVTTYESEHIEQVEVEEVIAEPVEEEDVVDQATRELERINTILDEKEKELLEQRGEIDTELERIRETRASFQ